ncbi:MAG: LuxR C-terminal-related transcriptional regulator [Bacteroidota bacterium]
MEAIARVIKDSTFTLGGISDTVDNTRTLLNQYAPEFLFIHLNTSCKETNALVNRFKTVSPRTRILVMGNPCDCETVFNAIKAGADVFLPENLDLDRLPDILSALLENEFYLPAYIAKSLLEKSKRENQSPTEFPFILTNRERAILNGFSSGMTMETVAGKLDVSPDLVKAHAYNILQKIHFVDIAQKQYENITSGLSQFRSSFEY